MRAPVYHQYGPGSIPAWLHLLIEFVVGSRPCSEGFSPGSPVFLPPKKTAISNSNSTRIEEQHGNHKTDMACFLIFLLKKTLVSIHWWLDIRTKDAAFLLAIPNTGYTQVFSRCVLISPFSEQKFTENVYNMLVPHKIDFTYAETLCPLTDTGS